MSKRYAEVILDLSIDRFLTYEIPELLAEQVQQGSQVRVPVRNTARLGMVAAFHETTSVAKPKPILDVLSDQPSLPPDLLSLILWMAKYYCTPVGKVLRTVLPSSIRQQKKSKEQLFVSRGKSREELRLEAIARRSRSPAQANVLDVLLGVTKGIFLTELLEKADCTRSPVDTLAKQGLLVVEPVVVDRSAMLDMEYFPTQPKILNDEQKQALEAIQESLKSNRFDPILLQGVTGSGKTEVYLQAMQSAMDQNKQVLLLVPEVSLTVQTIERFQSRFPGKMAVLHHRLSDGERLDAWKKIHAGEVLIVIGARSAVFCPLPNLGLVIVDEEQETSYKQSDEMPCYHARDVAVMRGKIGSCPVVLGTATPSLETYANAKKGKYRNLRLNARADKAHMPKVEIVPMQQEYEKAGGYTLFSQKLLDGIEKRVKNGEKILLFLNRRGYHTCLLCPACSHLFQCTHCDVALTFHKQSQSLRCHMCGEKVSPPPRQCPHCKNDQPLQFKGVGTEQVQRTLHAIFPDLRTLRMDADTTRHKGSHEQLLREFASGKADVLIGTQMIAKGLHFPDVTLVAVLQADQGLQIPDFRASEQVFQQLTQVAGRAGRGAIPGEVLIQTLLPEHSTLLHAATQDVDAFFEEEIQHRELFGFPPFAQMVKFCFSSKDESRMKREAHDYFQTLTTLLPPSFTFLPLSPPGHAKVKDWHRMQFLLVAPSLAGIPAALHKLKEKKMLSQSVKLLVDVNPLSTYF